MLKSNNNFTILALFMYVTPVLIDLTSNGMKSRAFKLVKNTFVVYNAVFLLFCFFGLVGIIVDHGDTFIVYLTAVFNKELVLQKRIVAFTLLLEIFVPICLLVGSPSRDSKNAVEYVLKEGTK